MFGGITLGPVMSAIILRYAAIGILMFLPPAVAVVVIRVRFMFKNRTLAPLLGLLVISGIMLLTFWAQMRLCGYRTENALRNARLLSTIAILVDSLGVFIAALWSTTAAGRRMRSSPS